MLSKKIVIILSSLMILSVLLGGLVYYNMAQAQNSNASYYYNFMIIVIPESPTTDDNVSVSLKLDLASVSYSANFSLVSKVDNDFFVTVDIYLPEGIILPAIYPVEETYYLGELVDGLYSLYAEVQVWHEGAVFPFEQASYSKSFTVKPEISPRTWTVDDDGPADFQTIQEAISAANEGDTILVYNGTYRENVVINKTVSLIGENKKTTIIDGNETGTVVLVIADSVAIKGFTIQRSGTTALGSFWDDDCGIRLLGSGNTVEESIVTNNLHGIIIGYPKWGYPPYFYGTAIVSNTIGNNSQAPGMEGWGIGIMMFLSSSSVIRGNTVHPNSCYGIYLESSRYIVISENMVSNCMIYSVVMAVSDDNVIYHNTFNNPAVSTVSSNTWDCGYPSGGNYWGDYNGTDNCWGVNQDLKGYDMIGDTPYLIDENNTDTYPLMTPWRECKPPMTEFPDLDGDGYVGITDLYTVAKHFGEEFQNP